MVALTPLCFVTVSIIDYISELHNVSATQIFAWIPLHRFVHLCFGWFVIIGSGYYSTIRHSWPRHQTETFSTLLAHCKGNLPVTSGFPLTAAKPMLMHCRKVSFEHIHDDVIKWKHFPRYWPFVWGIHRSPVNSLHKGQWRGINENKWKHHITGAFCEGNRTVNGRCPLQRRGRLPSISMSRRLKPNA